MTISHIIAIIIIIIIVVVIAAVAAVVFGSVDPCRAVRITVHLVVHVSSTSDERIAAFFADVIPGSVVPLRTPLLRISEVVVVRQVLLRQHVQRTGRAAGRVVRWTARERWRRRRRRRHLSLAVHRTTRPAARPVRCTCWRRSTCRTTTTSLIRRSGVRSGTTLPGMTSAKKAAMRSSEVEETCTTRCTVMRTARHGSTEPNTTAATAAITTTIIIIIIIAII
mmetsp:Transcript_6188/g.11901  ORF Transcript_6188/g.11901 Transcript_6188/m.11901 type:complete len:223 (+) Transcript_6188:537-1205(+)